MPETPTYGFPYETPQTKPGITLNGDSDGSSPILAEEVETVIAGLDARVSTNEGDITALQGLAPNDTGWQNLALTPDTGFTVNTALYRRWGPVVAIIVRLNRTGADITANAQGNIPDDLVATIDTIAIRPDQTIRVHVECSITSGSAFINTSGGIVLSALHTNSSLRTNDIMSISPTYFVATFN